MEDIHSINLARQHKAFNPASQQHKNLLQSSLEKTLEISRQHSYLDFTSELEYFSRGAQ